MAKTQEQLATKQPTIQYSFALANLAASATDVDIPILGGVVPTYAMPLGGCVVGYSINRSAAPTGGLLDIDIEIEGASVFTLTLNTTATLQHYALFEFGTYRFAASDTLGCTYTSDANLTAETTDAVVTLFVIFEDFDV